MKSFIEYLRESNDPEEMDDDHPDSEGHNKQLHRMKHPTGSFRDQSGQSVDYWHTTHPKTKSKATHTLYRHVPGDGNTYHGHVQPHEFSWYGEDER